MAHAEHRQTRFGRGEGVVVTHLAGDEDVGAGPGGGGPQGAAGTRPDGDVAVRGEPVTAAVERVVLGCRPCDVAALAAMDKVFQWDYDDVRYRAQRDRTTLVSFACTEPADDMLASTRWPPSAARRMLSMASASRSPRALGY